MFIQTRRAFLGTTILGGASLPLFGCNPSSTSSTGTTISYLSATAAQDLQTLAAGLPAVLAALQATGTLAAAQSAQVTSDITKAQAAASTLAAEPTIPTTDTTLQTFESVVSDALGVANTIAPTNPVVIAASVIAPLVGVLVNTTVAAVSGTAGAPLPAPTMDVPTARLTLKAAAVRHPRLGS